MRAPLFIVLLICCNIHSFAQGGGPPMLTDDPGIVELHKWEINASVNPEATRHFELALPYLDINYGVLRNLQLKVEAPYLFSADHGRWSGAPGEVAVGVKYRFLDEEKALISAGTYPQWVLRGETGFLLPLLLEKSFGKFLIGTDIGYFLGTNHFDQSQLGTLIGYQATEKLQFMAEYFFLHNYEPQQSNEGFLNIGFRNTLSKIFTLMGSFGTQLVTPAGDDRASFFSWMGVQCSFGKEAASHKKINQ